jgi:Protein of unknown function (DUF998)
MPIHTQRSTHAEIPLLAAQSAFAASGISIALLVVLHLVKPELDPSWRTVSEYAIGRHGWLMTACFIAQSLGCAALFIAIRSQARHWVGYIGLFFLLAAAVGPAMAAIFPSDLITTPPAEVSDTGRMHSIAGIIGIPSLPIAAILLSLHLTRQSGWSAKRSQVLVSALVAVLSLLIMLVTVAALMPKDGSFGPDFPIGWPNRLQMLAYCGWVMTFGWQAAELARNKKRADR